MKNTPLLTHICNFLIMAIKGLYKAKCSFTKIAALNAIFQSLLFYNFNNFWIEQIVKFITTLLNQFNISTKLLYDFLIIRLFYL